MTFLRSFSFHIFSKNQPTAPLKSQHAIISSWNNQIQARESTNSLNLELIYWYVAVAQAPQRTSRDFIVLYRTFDWLGLKTLESIVLVLLSDCMVFIVWVAPVNALQLSQKIFWRHKFRKKAEKFFLRDTCSPEREKTLNRARSGSHHAQRRDCFILPAYGVGHTIKALHSVSLLLRFQVVIALPMHAFQNLNSWNLKLQLLSLNSLA